MGAIKHISKRVGGKDMIERDFSEILTNGSNNINTFN